MGTYWSQNFFFFHKLHLLTFLTFYLFLCFTCLQKGWSVFVQWRRAKQCIFLALGRLLAPHRFGAGPHAVSIAAIVTWCSGKRHWCRQTCISSLLNETLNYACLLEGLFLSGFILSPAVTASSRCFYLSRTSSVFTSFHSTDADSLLCHEIQ